MYRSAAVFFIIIGVSTLVFPRTSAAQTLSEPNTVTVTPFLGAGFGTSDDLGGSLALGFGVEYELSKKLGFEGEVSHLFDVLGDDPNQDWSVTNVSGNALYYFNVPKVTPYATFGIGVERSSPSVKVPDPAALYPASSTEVAYNFGGGVKYPISEQFLVRGDLRRFQANDLAPDYWRLYAGLTWWIKR